MAADLKNKRLALFFTRGISLGTWRRMGNLEREIKYYLELSRFFKEIFLFTYGGPEDAENLDSISLPENVKIFPKKWKAPSMFYSLLMPFLYRREISGCDILKTNQMDGSWTALIAGKIFGKKTVVRCGYEVLSLLTQRRRAWWKRTFARCAEWLAYKAADRIIITSEKDKNFIIRTFGTDGKKISVIPNYIDVNRFKPLGFPREEKAICYVGRISEEKNVVNLVKSLKGLDASLKIIGEGPLKEEVKKIARDLSLDVRLMGNIPNSQVAEEMNRSAAFILPSLYEGNPKVLLEAMACGLPVIGTEVEGIKEILIHKVNGYLCRTDAESIGEAIKKVIGDKTLREKMGREARKTILEGYSLEKVLERETALYREL